jgi:hypothetical protein
MLTVGEGPRVAAAARSGTSAPGPSCTAGGRGRRAMAGTAAGSGAGSLVQPVGHVGVDDGIPDLALLQVPLLLVAYGDGVGLLHVEVQHLLGVLFEA